MRFLCSLFCFALLVVTAHGKIEKNDFYGVSINLPDSAGWVQTKGVDQAPQGGSFSVLALTDHPAKQARVSLSVLKDLPSTNLSDSATVQAIESLLRQFGFELRPGSSTIQIAGRNWKQFSVVSKAAGQPVSGLVRCTLANEKVFMVTVLRGGAGAAQDSELVSAAASVIFLAPVATVASTQPGGAPVLNPAAQPSERSTPGEAKTAAAPDKPRTFKVGTLEFTEEQVRMIMMVSGGLFVLILLFKIIGGGKKPPPPPPPATQRRGL